MQNNNKYLAGCLFLCISLLLPAFTANAQEIHGDVYERVAHDDHFHLYPLPGAHVVWLGTTSGATTNANGHFHLRVTVDLPHEIVVSYMGYQNDTILIESANQPLEIVLQASRDLQEVEVTARQLGTHVSSMQPILTHVITGGEMQRAACCNLAEAFETNISVDVSYSDAVSGAQQIQMLGLAGIYSQLLLENTPGIRGLGQPFGLSYVPGPWMESISISKGAATVINGYESVTGQINVEFKKPEGPEKVYFNAFASSEGQFESSLNAAFELSDEWSAMILAHGEFFDNKVDHNHNSFLDHPLVKKYNVMNRYRYERHGSVISQFGFNFMQEEREGGQKEFFTNNEPLGSDRFFGFGTNTTRFQAFARTGFFFENLPNASLGTQLQFTHHDQESFYGQRPYDGEQNTFYANVLFTNSIRDSDHAFAAGISYLLDDFKEQLNDSIFERRESVPGAFFEYSYHSHERMTLVLAGRVDHHNMFGLFLTPRMHVHFNLNDATTIRASAGKGYRVPNMIAENTGLLVSNRTIVVRDELEAEEAWNYGGSITRRFDLFGNEASLAAEVYRTNFKKQLIVDVDTDHTRAIFYNLDGDSYANNYQLEFNLEPLRRLETVVAYRFTDVKATIGNELRAKPFVNRYRGMISSSYATRENNWQFDLTAQFNGRSRLPDVPASYNMPEKSPSYTLLNGQVTYRWSRIDLYVGAENLTDYIQKNPIINPGNPFDEGFDGSMIWGPLMGRKFYMGLRFTIDS